MKTKRIIILCIAMVMLIYNTNYSDIIYYPIKFLSIKAYDIIEGKVAYIESKWDEKYKIINTFITIEVMSSIKGVVTEKKIILKEPGGKLNGFTTWFEYQPIFYENEVVLVFLEKKDNYYSTFGFNQGKFKIETLNGEKTVKREINKDNIMISNENMIRDDIRTAYKYEEIINIINNNLK